MFVCSKNHTLTEDSTTEALAWASLGVTLSMILCASLSSLGVYVEIESRINTCPHLSNQSNLLSVKAYHRVVAVWNKPFWMEWHDGLRIVSKKRCLYWCILHDFCDRKAANNQWESGGHNMIDQPSMYQNMGKFRAYLLCALIQSSK